MAIIVNGITIPTNSDSIFSNNVNIDRVVANGITVWEKQKELVLHDSISFWNGRVDTPYYEMSTSTNANGEECAWSTYKAQGNDWYINGWEEGLDIWDKFNHNPCPSPSPKLKQIRDMDLTNFNKVVLTFCGDIWVQPSSGTVNDEYIHVGFDFPWNGGTHYKRLARWHTTNDGSNGEENWKSGLCYTVNGADREQGPLIWNNCSIDVSDLVGVHRLYCFIWNSGYRNGGWLRLSYIKLC